MKNTVTSVRQVFASFFVTRAERMGKKERKKKRPDAPTFFPFESPPSERCSVKIEVFEKRNTLSYTALAAAKWGKGFCTVSLFAFAATTAYCAAIASAQENALAETHHSFKKRTLLPSIWFITSVKKVPFAGATSLCSFLYRDTEEYAVDAPRARDRGRVSPL